jgi:hypothetical protein
MLYTLVRKVFIVLEQNLWKAAHMEHTQTKQGKQFVQIVQQATIVWCSRIVVVSCHLSVQKDVFVKVVMEMQK